MNYQLHNQNKPFASATCPLGDVDKPLAGGSFIMQEIWKDIKGYEGHYQISNKGNVKSLERIFLRNGHRVILRERILALHKDSIGYWSVKLCKYGKTKHGKIHRLIAIAFIPMIENKNHVNHINGIKDDNRIENLEWCNHKENMEHANRTGLIVRRSEQYTSIRRKVIDEKTGVIFNSIKDASISSGVNRNTLISYLLGNRKNKTTLRILKSNTTN